MHMRLATIVVLSTLFCSTATAQSWQNTAVSQIQPGAAANASSGAPRISPDGRWIAFNSGANNVVTGQIDSIETDVFLHDRQANSTTLVSHAADNPLRSSAPGFSQVKAIGGAGLVLFDSNAPFLIAGETASYVPNVLLHDPANGNNRLLSHAAGSSARSNGECQGRALDPNALAAVIACTSTNLQTGVTDNNNLSDLYFHDVGSNTNSLITHVAGNLTAASDLGVDAFNGSVAISEDRLHVAFTSRSTNLVAGGVDTNNAEDVFVYDVQTGAIKLVSHIAGNNASTGAAGATLVAVQAGIVVFNSSNPNHVNGATDTNNGSDVFSFDISNSSITLVSHAAGANLVAGNGASTAVPGPLIERIVIETTATNLVNGLSGAMTKDVVFCLRTVNVCQLASHASTSATTRANAAARAVALNMAGTRVVFETSATNVVAGFSAPTTNASNLYVYDTATTATKLVSHRHAQPAIGSARPADPSARIDGSGNHIAFSSLAGDLSPSADGNATADVYVYDYAANASILVSRAAFALPTSGDRVTAPVGISADGRYVLQRSSAGNLAFDQIETDNDADVFVFDAETGTQTLVSAAIEGFEVLTNVPANAASNATAISGDGNWILFSSAATNLLAFQTDTNAATDVFLANRTGGMSLVSHASNSTAIAANAAATPVAISSNGQFVLYESNASNAIAGVSDTNATTDVFLFDRLTNQSVLVSHASSATNAANERSDAVALSPDGRFVLYQSRATNLVAGFVNNNAQFDDVYLYDRLSGISRLISHAFGTPAGGANAGVNAAGLSDNGDRIVCHTAAGNLIGTGTSNGQTQIFIYQVSTGTMRLVSHSFASETDLPNGFALPVAISGNGAAVLFSSNSNSIINAFVDGNGAANDVYWYDTNTRLNTLFSRSNGNATTSSNREWHGVQINRDASRAVFLTLASDVISGVNAGSFFTQVYQYERASASMSLVSHREDSATMVAQGSNGAPVMSEDGDRVAFDSDATNLFPWTDLNAARDTFLARRVTSFVVTPVVTGNGSIDPNGPQTVAPGATVAFTLIPGLGQRIASASGCDGALIGNVYTTAAASADCTVNFAFAPQQYVLRYFTDPHGVIDGDWNQVVDYGSDGTEVRAIPDVGYDFDGWSDNRPGAVRTDTNVTADLTVTATFTIQRFNLLYTAGAGGTINGQPQQLYTVDYGTDGPPVTAIPDPGKVFVRWTDNVMTAQRTDLNVTAHVTVQAEFAASPNFTVTPVIGANGSASPNAPQSVAPGGTTFFDLTPAVGYRIGSAAGCGGALAGARFTTGPVNANCSVTVAFNRIPVAQNGTLDGVVEDGGSYGGTLSANDDDAFTVVLVTPPTKGQLILQANQQYFYTTSADANGSDSFTFKINDGVQDSNVATVTIPIAPVNDRPSFELNPATLPEHAQGTSGPQTRAGMFTAVDFGPPDEDASQSIASVQAFEIFDPANILSNVSISPAGALAYSLSGGAGLARVSVSIVDSGGTANGGSAASESRQLTISVRNATDLRVSNTNGQASVSPGQTVVYEVLASNAGPYATTGALFNVPVPAGLGNVLWTCNSVQIATCPQASGSGAINGLALDLPNGAVLRFFVTGTITAANGSTVQHTATITTAAPMFEVAVADNTATDADPVAAAVDLVFRNGFETSSGSTIAVPAGKLLYPPSD